MKILKVQQYVSKGSFQHKIYTGEREELRNGFISEEIAGLNIFLKNHLMSFHFLRSLKIKMPQI